MPDKNSNPECSQRFSTDAMLAYAFVVLLWIFILPGLIVSLPRDSNSYLNLWKAALGMDKACKQPSLLPPRDFGSIAQRYIKQGADMRIPLPPRGGHR